MPALSLPSPERVIGWLAVLVASGITAVLPVLPLYAKEMGADTSFIGVMMAAYWVANLFGLPVGGWLSDRFGRRLVMGLGLATYGLASAGFLLLTDTHWFVLLRAVEGLAGACFMPAAMAYLAECGAPEVQGSRMARLAAAENIGVLLGPVAGGAVASVWGLGAPFACFALFSLMGLLLLGRLPEIKLRPQTSQRPQLDQSDWHEADWGLAIGVGFRLVAAGFSIGLGEVIWPLFMTDLGAELWHISLSWTLFAVPSILMSPCVGRMIDRVGAGRPAVFGAAVFAGVALFYPLAPGPLHVLALSVTEGLGFAFAYPGQNALLIQTGPEAIRGRMIGLVSTVKTLAAVVGALLTPVLYAMSPYWCFGAMAVVHVVGILGLAIALMVRKKRTVSSAA